MESCVWSCLPGKFTPASAGCHKQAKHIISTSIFQLPYGHNDPAIYADGVLRLAYAVGRQLPDFTLRIFVDGSLVIPTPGVRPPSPRWLINMRKMANMPHVQLVYSACPGVFNPATHGHYDLFGTMLRFTPMFAASSDATTSPTWLAPPAEGGIAVSFDSDMPDPELHFYLNAFKEFSTSPFDIFSIAAPCTDVPWNEGPKDGIYQILAGLFGTRVRFPQEWFKEFLTIATAALKNPTDSTNLVAAHAARVRAFAHGAFHTYRQIDNQTSPFVYGIDEIFLNHFLRPKLVAWDRQTRFLQLIMNMLLRGVDAIVHTIEIGGKLKTVPDTAGSEVPEAEVEGPFVLSNSHVQRVLAISSEVILGEPLYGPILSQDVAAALAKRIIAEMRRTMNHSYTLARAYCNPTFLPDTEYARRVAALREVLTEAVLAEQEGAVPTNSFHKYIADCWNVVGTLEPYAPVVHLLGNGKSVPETPDEAALRLGRKETLCPPRPRKTKRKRSFRPTARRSRSTAQRLKSEK